jgi:predicted enzyme related to lactoylglutathione lyase
MNKISNSPEFRLFYSTPLYAETVSFYKNRLQLEELRSWDRGTCQKGTIFRSPNGTGQIEIEEGTIVPVLQGELYIEVDDVDHWYEKIMKEKIRVINPVSDTSYGHRSFKFSDPNNLIIGLFKYNL